jgi:hypothetical protein
MSWIPRPSENADVAIHIGMNHDLLATDPQWEQAIMEPIMMIAGTLPLPLVETSFSYTEFDTDVVSKVKKSARIFLDSTVRKLRQANDDQLKTNRDNRFSSEGRAESLTAVYQNWAGRSDVMGFAEVIDSKFRELNDELRLITRPGPLYGPNAAGAVLESEYRGIVRALPTEAERIVFLHKLAHEDPHSPIMTAVLRADPIASAIGDDHFNALAMRHGLSIKAKDIIGIWGAGCMIDCVAWIVQHGTQRLAKASGNEWSATHSAIDAAIEQSPNRRELAESIESMIKIAGLVRIIREEE